MCGITGFVRKDEADITDIEILHRMTRSLAHRGPDDEGFYTDKGAFLGHRRLSIIDVAHGKQPLTNEDGRVAIVFNGEIYNHHDLRHDLMARGHIFRTRSDTEVLVHLWEDEREGMIGRLEGMFAFALWDSRDRTLLLARDRMGKKPLYYGIFMGEIVFASELRALLIHPSVGRDIDVRSLYRYLTLDYVPAPRSILKQVNKVEAGGYVLFSKGVAREGRYTDIKVPKEALKLGFSEATSAVWQTLCESTKRRLESEVPLGVFLSGGLDSTAVLAAMTNLVPPNRISTFTIGFDDPSFDESGPARVVARHFGTDHHESVLSGEEAVHLVRDVAGIVDEPLADPSVIPTFLLSRFARRHITVALSGDGGDELFYGYPTFIADSIGEFFSHVLPMSARLRIPRIATLLPTSDKNWSLPLKIERFARGLSYGRYERQFAWIGSFSPEMARFIMNAEVDEPPYPDCNFHLSHCEGWPPLKKLAYLYCKLYLGEGVLAKVDRSSMAVGLEVRSPFLDSEMVRLAFALPPSLSLSGRTTKILIRRMLANRVPSSILSRPKKGFGIPLARWLRTDLRPLISEFLAPKKLLSEGFFRPDVVSKLVNDHMSGRRDYRKEIYALLVFELWLSRWIL